MFASGRGPAVCENAARRQERSAALVSQQASIAAIEMKGLRWRIRSARAVPAKVEPGRMHLARLARLRGELARIGCASQ